MNEDPSVLGYLLASQHESLCLQVPFLPMMVLAFPTDICLSHGTCLKIYALMSSLQSQVFFSVPPVVSGTKFSKLVKFTAADKARILVYIGCCMDV